MVVSFSSDYCRDGGRAINNLDSGWHQSLQGHAERACKFYEQHLQTLGYKARAQVLNYPDRIPGDIGLSIKW